MFWKRKQPEPYFLRLGPDDGLVEGDLWTGILATGATGSGKSSTLAHLLVSLMRRGWGMLYLCSKPDDMLSLCHLAIAAGRTDDVMRVAPGCGYSFDFVGDAIRGAGGVEAAAGLMEEVGRVLSRTGNAKPSDPFWENASARQIRLTMYVLTATYGSCNVGMIYDFVTGLPTSLEAAGSEAFKGTFCFRTLAKLHGEETWKANPDAVMGVTYATSEFPLMSDRTSTGISANSVTLLSRFMHGDIRPLCSGPTTACPADVLELGKIVAIDTPELVYKEAGRAVQQVWKAAFLREALRRDTNAFPHGVCLFMDEYQQHATPALDSMAQAVARSQRLCVVAATQNFPLIEKALGSKPDAEALVANFQTKLMFNNSCPVTVKKDAETIGKGKRLMFSGGGESATAFDALDDFFHVGKAKGNVSFSEQLQFVCPPETFGRLKSGGPRHGNVVECIAYSGVRRFSNGRNWMRASVQQRKR